MVVALVQKPTQQDLVVNSVHLVNITLYQNHSVEHVQLVLFLQDLALLNVMFVHVVLKQIQQELVVHSVYLVNIIQVVLVVNAKIVH